MKYRASHQFSISQLYPAPEKENLSGSSQCLKYLKCYKIRYSSTHAELLVNLVKKLKDNITEYLFAAI